MNVREWALPVYTILMQLATGTLLTLGTIRFLTLKQMEGKDLDRILRRPVLVMFFTVLLAIIGSHFHLSNPLLSFMAVINFANSWLSREIVFTILMFFTCAALVDLIGSPNGERQRVKTVLGALAVLFGGAAIYCMANIYLLPTQAPWNNASTIFLFFGSSLLLGVTSVLALLIMDTIFSQEYEADLFDLRLALLKKSTAIFSRFALVALLLILSLNAIQLLAVYDETNLAHVSMTLLLQLYPSLLAVRFILLILSVGLFLVVISWLKTDKKNHQQLVLPVYAACFIALIGEILGRFLFYASHVRIGL